MTVLPFLTTRPQTKRALAERMGITQRTVEELVLDAGQPRQPQRAGE